MEIWHGHALCPNELYCVRLYITLTILHNKTKKCKNKTGVSSITVSTVVLNCCKGDKPSQWEYPIFGPM